MKKRFIPATVAALALSFSAVAVPQAAAQQPIEIDVIDGETLELEAGQPFEGYKIIADEDETVTVEGLPEGLTFDSETNVVSGTPTTHHAQGQSSTVVVTIVNDSDDVEDETATATIIITADDTDPVIEEIGDREWEVNSPIEPVEIEVSEEATVTVTGLPEGLRYDPEAGSDDAAGAIVGTPTQATAAGTSGTVRVNATDAAGNEADEVTITYTVSVDTTAPVITDITDQTLEVGTAVDIEVEVSEPATVVVEGLPDGLSYNAETGRIVGVPTAVTPAGELAEVTVNATDAADNEADEVTFTITVGPDVTDPVIENPGSQRFVVNDEIDPLEIEVNETATVSVDGLPVGLSFDPEELVISGTPTVSGNPVTVTIRAVDEAGNSSTETFTVTVVDAQEDPSSIGSGEGSSADDVNWGLVGLGGVLAAVIGVIAAIGGGFIQLPPALANLIPFL